MTYIPEIKARMHRGDLPGDEGAAMIDAAAGRGREHLCSPGVGPTAPAGVLVVDDHAIVIAGLRLLLSGDVAYRVVAEAGSAEDACLIAEREQPRFIIADIVLGGRDGPDMVEDLVAVAPRSLILSYSSLDDSHAAAVIRAGARGFVCKADGLEQVADALDCMGRGVIWASERVMRQLASTPADPADGLSARERQVYQRIGQDLPLQTIARQMGVSVKTIGTYRERLKMKLGLDTARELEQHARAQVARRERPR